MWDQQPRTPAGKALILCDDQLTILVHHDDDSCGGCSAQSNDDVADDDDDGGGALGNDDDDWSSKDILISNKLVALHGRGSFTWRWQNAGVEMMSKVHSLKVMSLFRDAWAHQHGWIFGKLPNGLWPPPRPRFGKLWCTSFREVLKSATEFFGSEMTPPPFGSFQKFIEFGPGNAP